MADSGINELIKELLDSRAEAQKAALEKVRHMPQPQALSVLEKLFKEATAEARATAFKIMASYPEQGEEFHGLWARLAVDGNREVRAEALEAAARLQGGQATQLLALFASDPDPILRRRMLVRMLVSGDAAAAEVALGRADDPDATVRQQVVQILARFMPPAGGRILARLAFDGDVRCRTAAFEELQKRVPFKALLTSASMRRSGIEPPAEALNKLALAGLSGMIQDGVNQALALGEILPSQDLAPLLAHLPNEVLDGWWQPKATAQPNAQTENGPAVLPDWLALAIAEHDARAEPDKRNCLPRLLEACSHKLPGVRELAMQGIVRHEASGICSEVLEQLLLHPSPDVRRSAVLGLAQKGERALGSLREALSDPDQDVRRAAYETLAAMMPEDAERIWNKALRDGDESIQGYAALMLQLRREGGTAGPAAAKSVSPSQAQAQAVGAGNEAVAEAEPLSEKDMAVLRHALSGPREREDFQKAVQTAALLPPAEAAELLFALLDSGTPEARQAVFAVLQEHPDRSSAMADVWGRLATAKDREARAEALQLASNLSPGKAVIFLQLWLNDDDLLLRRRALVRLLFTNREEAVEPALRCIKDLDMDVRLQAGRILARFVTEETLPPLVQLARDPDPRCRAMVFEALCRHAPFYALMAAAGLALGGPQEAQAEAEAVFNRFKPEKLLAMVSASVAKTVADGKLLPAKDLGALLAFLPAAFVAELNSQPQNPAWLRAAIIHHDAQAPLHEQNLLSRLVEACSDPAPELRTLAIQGLARHDASAPCEILGPLLRHPLPDVRRQVIEALAQAGPAAIPLLREVLSDRDPAIRKATYVTLAALLSEDDIAIWHKALRDKETAIAVYAVERLLAAPDSYEVQSALVSAARHKEAAVRSPAVKALVRRDIVLPTLSAAYMMTLKEVIEAKVLLVTPPELVIALLNATLTTFPPGAIAMLVATARCRSAAVRRAAVDALAAKHPDLVLDVFASLADTEDPDILKRVALALAGAKDPRALIPLLRAHDECQGLAATVDKYLENYPDVKHLKFLISLLRMRWPSLKRFGARQLLELDSPEMIEPLLQATKDPDVEVQRVALQALAKFAKRPEVYARLIEIRDGGGNESIRQNAVATILGLDSPSVIGPLIEASRDEDLEVQLASLRALGKFATRPEVYQRLIEVLDYGDVSVRELSVRTLGENKITDAVPALIRFLGNPFLKFRVREALRDIGDRKGMLAIKRFEIREKYFGKKKTKGPIAPSLRKGKVGLGMKVSGPATKAFSNPTSAARSVDLLILKNLR